MPGKSLSLLALSSTVSLFTVSCLSAGAALSQTKGQAMAMTPPVVPAARAPRAVASADKTNLAVSNFPATKRGTHYEIGMYLKEHGEIDGALVEFLKSTQENPRLSQAFYEQAVIFRDRNYLKLAESSLQQALNVEPDYQKAQILLAMIRLQQGEFIQAASGLSKILNIAPPKFLPIPGMNANKSGESSSSGATNTNNNLAQANGQAVNSQAMNAQATLAPTDPALASVHSDVSKEIAPAPADSSNSFLNDLLKGIPGIDPAVPSPSGSTAAKSDASDLVASLVGSSTKVSTQKATNAELSRTKAQAEAQEEEKEAQPAKRSKGFRLFLFNPFGSDEEPTEASSSKQMPRPVKIRQPRQKRVKAKPTLATKAAYHTAADDARNLEGISKRKRRWLGRFFGGTDNSQTGPVTLPPDAKVTEVPVKKDNDPNYSAMLMSPPKAIPQPSPQTRTTNVQQDNGSQMRQTNQVIIGSGSANPQASQVISQVRAQSGIVTRQAPPQVDQIAFAAPRLPASPLNYQDAASPKQKTKTRELEVGIQKSQAITQEKGEPGGQNEDAWTLKLRDLALHGTDSLKGGEAFMFSEETGDATLFLANGQMVKRHVLAPRDPEEVTKTRRPDMNDPKGLQYNLSLLGKLLPRPEKQADKQTQESGITLNDLSKKQDNMWGWFRQTLNF